MIYNNEQLKLQLNKLGILPTDTVLIHSSMKAIGEIENGAEGFLNALIEYMKPGLLILPTHTWKDMDSEHFIYDPKTSPSCVGLLTNLFLKRSNTFRSVHPTHSVAAIGKNAKQFTNGEENSITPCPRTGCWGKLYDINAKILFVGCSLKRNTIIHGAEEWNNIGNRLSENPKILKRRTSNNRIVKHPMHNHFNAVGDISERYDKIKPALLKHNIATKGPLGNAETIVCKAKPMTDLVSQFLQKNNDLFLDHKPIPINWY